MSQFIEMAENISSRLSENSNSRVGPVEPVTLNIGGSHNGINPATRPLNQLQVQLSRQTVGAVGQEMVQQSARLRIRNFTRSITLGTVILSLVLASIIAIIIVVIWTLINANNHQPVPETHSSVNQKVFNLQKEPVQVGILGMAPNQIGSIVMNNITSRSEGGRLISNELISTNHTNVTSNEKIHYTFYEKNVTYSISKPSV